MVGAKETIVGGIEVGEGVGDLLLQCSQHADRGDAWEKEVGAAAHFHEARDAGVVLAHGLALDGECAG